MVISINGFAQTKVVVIPLGGDDAPTSKTIFVTSVTYNGNLGGISGADDKCQAEADGATPPVPGIFKAWLSTDITESIPNRASFIKHNLPYNNVNGDNVANNFDDFLDGAFNSIIDRVDAPNDSFQVVWTGTSVAGASVFANCVNWTDASDSEIGTFGWSDGGTSVVDSFTDNALGFCNGTRRLYCYEQ